MATAERADPAVEAWRAIIELTMAGGRPRFPAVAQELGLSPQQLGVLRMLAKGGEVPMRAMAGHLFCDPSNVTGIVDRLETRGLIERRPDPADRRVKLLAITRAGLDLLVEADELLFRPPAALGNLSRAEQRELRDLLRKALA